MESIGTRQDLPASGLPAVLWGAKVRHAMHLAGTLACTASMRFAAALVATDADPALAVDATGTWSGSSTCWERSSARVTRTEPHCSTMRITQRGEALFVEIDGMAYRGESRDSNRAGTRARGRAARAEAVAPPSEVLTLKIRVDAEREMTRINAESTVPNTGGGRRCRYRYSRISPEDPGLGLPPPVESCGDGVVNDAPNEDCDGAATGTPCDGACTSDCRCPASCEPLDVTGSWEGTWVSNVTGESGRVVADLYHNGEFVFGPISFPPFGDENFSPPFLQISPCAPAEFSSGAILKSGIAGLLDGTATNTSMAGTWRMSDRSDSGTWQMSR